MTAIEPTERGYDLAISTIRSWIGHGLSASTDERLEAVASDLETNKPEALRSAPQEPDDATFEWFRSKWVGDHEEMIADLRKLLAADRLQPVAQEPVADDDAEWLRTHFIGPDLTQSTCPPIWMQSWQERLERIAARIEATVPRYAQPCSDHEYITPECPDCGKLA